MKKYLVLTIILCCTLMSACFQPRSVVSPKSPASNIPDKSPVSTSKKIEPSFLTMTDDGNFNADEEITWREALNMFQKAYMAIYDQTEDKLDKPVLRAEFANYMARAYSGSHTLDAITAPVEYTDIADQQYKEDIITWSAAGFFDDGDDVTTFRPQENMTRIEVVEFLAKAAKRSNEWDDTGDSFADVTSDMEYYNIVMNGLCGYSSEK